VKNALALCAVLAVLIPLLNVWIVIGNGWHDWVKQVRDPEVAKVRLCSLNAPSMFPQRSLHVP
jgi:hypothetical protein